MIVASVHAALTDSTRSFVINFVIQSALNGSREEDALRLALLP
jgi:hypothetical protein